MPTRSASKRTVGRDNLTGADEVGGDKVGGDKLQIETGNDSELFHQVAGLCRDFGEVKATVEANKAETGKILTLLQGNGKPGIIRRLDRLEILVLLLTLAVLADSFIVFLMAWVLL